MKFIECNAFQIEERQNRLDFADTWRLRIETTNKTMHDVNRILETFWYVWAVVETWKLSVRIVWMTRCLWNVSKAINWGCPELRREQFFQLQFRFTRKTSENCNLQSKWVFVQFQFCFLCWTFIQHPTTERKLVSPFKSPGRKRLKGWTRKLWKKSPSLSLMFETNSISCQWRLFAGRKKRKLIFFTLLLNLHQFQFRYDKLSRCDEVTREKLKAHQNFYNTNEWVRCIHRTFNVGSFHPESAGDRKFKCSTDDSIKIACIDESLLNFNYIAISSSSNSDSKIAKFIDDKRDVANWEHISHRLNSKCWEHWKSCRENLRGTNKEYCEYLNNLIKLVINTYEKEQNGIKFKCEIIIQAQFQPLRKKQ